MINTNILVYQAKSFYNAYIALEQFSRDNSDLLYYVPMIVNGAFSIELTLKAILAKNKIEYEKEHNLFKLFNMLPRAFQDEFLDYMNSKTPEYLDTNTFIEELILISDAFVSWRYSYENTAPALNSRFLSAFANAAICTMFAHYNVDLVPSCDDSISDQEVEEKFRANREKSIEAFMRKHKNGKEHLQ